MSEQLQITSVILVCATLSILSWRTVFDRKVRKKQRRSVVLGRRRIFSRILFPKPTRDDARFAEGTEIAVAIVAGLATSFVTLVAVILLIANLFKD